MSPLWISLMFTAGASAWIYTKFQRSSGNNSKQSVVGTAVSAVVIFLLSFSILTFVF